MGPEAAPVVAKPLGPFLSEWVASPSAAALGLRRFFNILRKSRSNEKGAGCLRPENFMKSPRGTGGIQRLFIALFRVVSLREAVSLVPIHSQRDGQLAGLCADGIYWPANLGSDLI